MNEENKNLPDELFADRRKLRPGRALPDAPGKNNSPSVQTTPERGLVKVGVKQSADEAGKHFASPQEEFPYWDDIYAAVQERFKQESKELVGGHIALAEEEAYYNLVAKTVDRRGEWATPINLPVLVSLLRRYQFGYGAVQDYLDMEGIEEIYFNRFDEGFYKRDGQKFRIEPPIFRSEKEMKDLTDRIAEENGLSIDLAHPVLDARLQDGSRLNVIIPPVALDGISMVIRKHREIPLTIEDYLRTGLLTQEAADDLRRFIVGGLRIIISGGTASGKTTMLNVLINAFTPSDVRIIFCEDTPELQIQLKDKKGLTTQKDATHDIRDDSDITLGDLIRYSLRLRPDRIIVGEVRGMEALDVLLAWNTGHEGSFLTLHANSAVDGLSKLEQLAVSAHKFSQPGVQDLIGRVVDIVVQIEEIKFGQEKGQRKLKEMVQVIHQGNIQDELRERFQQLKTEETITELWEGVFILPLYTRQTGGELVKLNGPLANLEDRSS